jgi:hypothetical protein
MFIVACFIAVCVKCWCQFPEDGEVIAPKHVEAVRVNCRTVHLLVVRELLL